MSRPAVVIDLASAATTIGRDLSAGGVFVGECGLQLYADCELVVRAGDGRELRTAARVVWVEPGRGAGLELVGFGADLRGQLDELVEATKHATGSMPPGHMAAPEFLDDVPSPESEIGDPDSDSVSASDSDSDPDSDPDSVADDLDEDTDVDASGRRAARNKLALNVHERVRGLTQVQALKMALTGELAERVALEKIYSKSVWDSLLRNPRISPPEVARIARMGSIPRPTIEVIVGNGAWLQVPEIRRALLANPKLGVDQVLRILRIMPKPELKLATIQTAYPIAVREAARKLFRD